jgi:hypothetical protein
MLRELTKRERRIESRDQFTTAIVSIFPHLDDTKKRSSF